MRRAGVEYVSSMQFRCLIVVIIASAMFRVIKTLVPVAVIAVASVAKTVNVGDSVTFPAAALSFKIDN